MNIAGLQALFNYLHSVDESIPAKRVMSVQELPMIMELAESNSDIIRSGTLTAFCSDINVPGRITLYLQDVPVCDVTIPTGKHTSIADITFDRCDREGAKAFFSGQQFSTLISLVFNDGYGAEITIGVTGQGVIDWGDGTALEPYEEEDQYTHTYAEGTGPFYIGLMGSVEKLFFLGGGLIEIRTIKTPTHVVDINILQAYDMYTLDISAYTNLEILQTNSCNNITDIDISNNPLLSTLSMQQNALSSATIDNLLIQLAAGEVEGGYADFIEQIGGAVPGPPGMAAKATLVSRGWTVNHD